MKNALLVFFAFAASANAQVTGLQFDTTNASIKNFATNIAISGNEVLANGAEMLSIPPPYEYRAFLFEYNGSSLVQTQAFLPDDIAIGDEFGKALDIDGEWLAIGAPGQNAAALADKGAVYVYHKINGTWTFAQKLTDASGSENDKFGSYVTISGDSMFVSSSKSMLDDTHYGTIHIYKRNGVSWDFDQNINDTSVNVFGAKTILKDGHLITCSQTQNGSTFRIYSYVPLNDSWTLEAVSDDYPSNSFVADPYAMADFAYDNGKLYVVYQNSMSSVVSTLQLQGSNWIPASENNISMDFLGGDFVYAKIVVEDGTVVLGPVNYILQMPRKFEVKVLHDNAGQLEYVNTLVGLGTPGMDDYFGSALALDGNILAVGAPNEGSPAPLTGKGYLFDMSLGTPTAQMAHVKAYPNPAGNVVFLEAGNNIAIESTEIYSSMGVKLRHATTNTNQIDVSDLPVGAYILRARFSDGSMACQKILKR